MPSSSMSEVPLRARDVMTPDVISVAPDAKVPEIARILLECHITGVPVIAKDGALLGMVSETDLERALQRPDARAVEVMSGRPVTVAADADLGEVQHVFDERHVRRVVVVRDDGRPLGILTRSDALKGFARQWDRVGLPPDPDMDALRQRVADVLDRYEGTTSTVKVVVVEGIAHLWGVVDSENERRAVHGAVAVVPGVLGVDNHLVVYGGPIPGSGSQVARST